MAAFRPRSVRIVTVVVADLTPKIISLPRILVDQRIVQVDPAVVDVGGSGQLKVGSVALELKNVGHKGCLASGIRVEGVKLLHDWLVARERLKGNEHHDQEHHESHKSEPYCAGVRAQRRRLIFVNSDALRRAALKAKRLPNIGPRNVLPHGPGNFSTGSLAR